MPTAMSLVGKIKATASPTLDRSRWEAVAGDGALETGLMGCDLLHVVT